MPALYKDQSVYNDDMTTSSVAQKETRRSRNIVGGPERRRGRPREFDRDQGLQQAMHLFWKQGYEATSMADLRKALGVTQASLYAAYGNKETLFRESVELYLRTDGNTTVRALSRPGSARDAVHAMLQDAVDAFTAHGTPGGCLIVLGATNCSANNRAVQEHLASLRHATLQRITKRFKQAQDQGELGKDVSVVDLAGYYAMVLHGLSIPASDGVSREELTRAVNLAMTTWPYSKTDRFRPGTGKSREHDRVVPLDLLK